ncbi:TIR domain-containing protein [Actinomycetospora sp. CA-101289]|uniref:toll/interleukin-1 receptor domain-containing protein n=1 Tax=Actinomycetospora sp. CA-101289 TaxID=3239893 RepID=UPI003D956B66
MSEHAVFLSYSSADRDAVGILARRLIDNGIEPWWDRRNLIPGEPWQESIERALSRCSVVVAFLGADGVGPWANEEIRYSLDRRARNEDVRVVPVLLPGAPDPADVPRMPGFLTRLTWVDFRSSLDSYESLQQLIVGIRGAGPDPLPSSLTTRYLTKVSDFAGVSSEIIDVRFGIPAWNDFPNPPSDKPLARRPELARKIIASLDSDKLHVLVGPSASGKTTLIKEIASVLVDHSNTQSYYLDVGQLRRTDNAGIAELNSEFTSVLSVSESFYLLIDNVHFAFNEVSAVVRQLRRTSPSVKILLSLVRDIPKYYAMLDESPVAWALQQPSLRTIVSSSDVADRIITSFSDTHQIDRGKLPTTSYLVDLCNHNLHHLNFCLLGMLEDVHASDKDTSSSVQATLDSKAGIRKYVLGRLENVRQKYGAAGLLALSAIATWSLYDVHIERSFLTGGSDQGRVGLAIAEDTIANLVRDGEIEEQWGLVGLPHRAVGIAYSDTLQQVHGVQALVRDEILSRCAVRGRVVENMVRLYLQFRPHSIDVISRHICNRTDVASTISTSPETIDAIFDLMMEQDDLVRLTEIFINFEWQNFRLSTELMNRMLVSSERLISMFNSQDSIVPIVHLLAPMWFVSGDSVKRGKTLVHANSQDTQQSSAGPIIECPYITPFDQFDRYQQDVVRRLGAGGIDEQTITAVSSPASEQNLLANSSICIKAFSYSRPVMCGKLTVADNRPGASLLKKIDERLLLRLLEVEESLKNVAYAFSVISYYDNALGRRIVEGMRIEHLLDVFNKCGDSEITTLAALLIGRMSRSRYTQVVANLDRAIAERVASSGWLVAEN